MRNLRGAWRMMTGDPVGIGLPTGGILLVELAATLVVRALWWELAWWQLLLLAGGLQCGVLLVTVPLRAALIGAAAETEGRIVASQLRTPALLAVVVVVSGLQAVLVGAVLLVGAGAVLALTSRGMYVMASVAIGAAGLLASAVSLVVRALFGYAPTEAVLGHRAGWRALLDGLVGRDVVMVLLLLWVGDLALLLGTLVCGIGALPGYPLGELAVLHRWLERQGAR